MKKLYSVFFAIILVLSLSLSCMAADGGLLISAQVPSFDAIIISSSYNSERDTFNICAVADLTDFGYPSKEMTPFTFSVNRADFLSSEGNTVYETFSEDDEMEPGLLIKIFFGGEFMESYPLQLGKVNWVTSDETYKSFDEGEFEKYYLMFYIELPEASDTTSDGNSQIDVEDDEIEEENPLTGIAVNPMKTILISFAILSIASIGIYLISALRKS